MKKILMASAFAFGAATSALAHSDDAPGSDAFAYRSGGFHMIKTWFVPMGGAVKGKIPYDAESFAESARNVAALASMMPAGFEDSTLHPSSEALPVIWENKADFDEKMQAFISASQTLASTASAASEVSQVKGAFIDVAKTCKGCHKAYRD